MIGQIEVLPALFGTVLVPSAVHQELQQPGTPAEVRSWIAGSPPWLLPKRVSVIDPSLDLDAGETQAIALAEEVGADLLLMDERKGSREARKRGLQTAGTLAILDRADLAGLLDFETALAKLNATNFHLSPVLINSLVNTVRARKQKS